MPIQIGAATVEYTPDGCVTRYPDLTHYGAQPHDTPDYREITRRCGYGDDILTYACEHEVCHHIVSEFLMGRPSQVLWPLAHGYEPDPADAVQEEALTMTFQRWLRAGERPIIGSVDWYGIRARALALLNAV